MLSAQPRMSVRRSWEECTGRWWLTNHGSLFCDNLAEVLEDLIQFRDSLFDLLNLAFSLLNKLLLELELRVGNTLDLGLLLPAQEEQAVTSASRSRACEMVVRPSGVPLLRQLNQLLALGGPA